MSRHKISSGEFTVFVGWDNPLNTFWCHVYDFTDRTPDMDDTDEPNWQVGQMPGECPTVVDLARFAAQSPYSERLDPLLTYAVLEQLVEDRGVAEPRTAHQDRMLRMLKELSDANE